MGLSRTITRYPLLGATIMRIPILARGHVAQQPWLVPTTRMPYHAVKFLRLARRSNNRSSDKLEWLDSAHWDRDKMAANFLTTISNAFFKENLQISIKISLKFVPQCPNNNIPALCQIMAWRRPCAKPLSEPMMVSLLTHIHVINCIIHILCTC